MVRRKDTVREGAAGEGEDTIVPFSDLENDQEEPQTDEEAEERGPDEHWQFWKRNIAAGLVQERRWRTEALESEELVFGPDQDTGATSSSGDGGSDPNLITDKTALIHANIETLKPLIYSETPQPLVRRRFRGDGKSDETDLMAAETGQRIAQFLLDTEPFDDVMELVRNDWLITDRGAGRVVYKANFSEIMVDLPDGTQQAMKVKTNETVCARHVPWRRLLLGPAENWESVPWIAIETPMTRNRISDRFGEDVAERFRFDQKGLQDADRGISDQDRDRSGFATNDETETGDPAISPFDTAMVWEIWDKDAGEVIWWSPSYQDSILDKEEDPLELEKFWPMPKPLLGNVRGGTLTPRPAIKYYERRAREVDLASQKLKTILDVVSISGLYPGKNKAEVEKILKGDNVMVGISDWIGLMEKGGSNNIIQWLPLNHMITAIQALITLREQSKQAMFEASGVSDIMRAQGDPNETATAQQIKGRYAGLRLSDRQRKMAIYCRDMIQLMVEIAVEHFDTKTIADITGLDIPETEAERQQMLAQNAALEQEYQQLAQTHQMITQAVEQGLLQMQPPPPPEPPKLQDVPETSYELVHERLRIDYLRKITVNIETESTVLADEQADKEARVEFLSAFSKFVAELSPLAGTGQMPWKVVKELLMFGIRGFPKSRTLEGMIASLPDEPEGEPPEDTQVKVTKIKGEIDKEIKAMEIQDNQAERQHEQKMKGVELMKEAAETVNEVEPPEPAQAQAAE